MTEYYGFMTWIDRPLQSKPISKKLLPATAILLLCALVEPAFAFLSVQQIISKEKDANRQNEVHLLLTGIRAPTENLHVETDLGSYDFAWSWDRPEADLWLSLGAWKRLSLVLTYADGSHDSATLGVWDDSATKQN